MFMPTYADKLALWLEFLSPNREDMNSNLRLVRAWCLSLPLSLLVEMRFSKGLRSKILNNLNLTP